MVNTRGGCLSSLTKKGPKAPGDPGAPGFNTGGSRETEETETPTQRDPETPTPGAAELPTKGLEGHGPQQRTRGPGQPQDRDAAREPAQRPRHARARHQALVLRLGSWPWTEHNSDSGTNLPHTKGPQPDHSSVPWATHKRQRTKHGP